MKNKKNIKMLNDFILNILASVILTFANQILAYPYISRMVSIDEYGLILTTMGIINVIGVSLGNPLNNTRILLQPQYQRKNISGDYNLIFLVALAINFVLVFTIISIYYKAVNFTALGATITSSLVLFRSYFSADYRIKIDYKRNLYASLFGLLGYIIGILITIMSDIWINTFIFGELFACIYIFFTAEIVRDKFVITALFRKSLYKYTYILIAAVLSSLMVYMDRFFIYPVLGPEYVSIYNVASFLGKTVGVVMGPIAGVLLTYYVKETDLSTETFCKRTIMFTCFSILCYLLILLMGPYASKILYPTIAESSMPYFAIANLGVIVFILGNLIQPTLLRYSNERWQPVIQGVYFILYIILGYGGMALYGLIGYCYAILIVNVIRVILMVHITISNLNHFVWEDEER